MGHVFNRIQPKGLVNVHIFLDLGVKGTWLKKLFKSKNEKIFTSLLS